jgi:IclR family pca regulon transcriptional regulator
MESTARDEMRSAMQNKGDPDKEFMTTLAKGLAVLGAFGRQRPTMTLSEAAQVADLSRATARRVLRTLSMLGYVKQEGRTFSPSPRILDFGFAYLSTQSWIDRALPLMRDLSERLGESSSAAILQGNDIVYVARVPARRIMSAALSVGSRLPALHTALGRILFGYLDERNLAAAEVATYRGLYPANHHRFAGAVRSHSCRPRKEIFHRR